MCVRFFVCGFSQIVLLPYICVFSDTRLGSQRANDVRPYILVLWFVMPQNRCALCVGFFICLAMLIPHSSLLTPHLNSAFHCILYLCPCSCLFCHFILRFCAILLLFLAVLTLKTSSLAPFLFKLYFLYLSNENLQNRKV